MARRAGMSFSFALDASQGMPLREQLYQAMRSAIVSGQLKPGERVASTRALASQLNLARNTVASAFEALVCEGYLTTRRGAAAVVAATLPESATRVPAPAAVRTTKLTAAGVPSLGLSLRGARIATARVLPERVGRGPAFRLGVPALDAFPADLWERMLRARWSRSSASLLSDTDRRGCAPLREAIADYVSVARGVPAHADRVIIVAGAQQAFFIVAQLLLDPGDSAWVEDPGYTASRSAIIAAGGVPIGMPVDDQGPNIPWALKQAPNARLAVVTPANQFPLGVSMSPARRTELISWATRTGAWILEDDYDGEFRYVGKPIAALASQCPERVVYVGTFSKVLAPSLRLGYLVVPDALVDAVLAAKAIAAARTATLEQAVVCDFITSGEFMRHVRRMRMLYGERRDSLAHAVHAELGSAASLRPIEAGMQAVLDVSCDVVALSAQAASVGVHVTPLGSFAVESRAPNALVLGFAAVPPAEQRRALRKLAPWLLG